MLSIPDGFTFIGRPVCVVRALVSLASSGRYRVEGDSMLPTLASKQHLLASSWNKLRRGHVVVLRQPVLTNRFYIKRIVGLPEEEVRLKEGRVYVNGSLLEEAYLDSRPRRRKEYDGEWWLGPDEYFVMGDNRNDSHDSRLFGPINRQLILGRVWFRCWPPSAWGPVPGRVKKSW